MLWRPIDGLKPRVDYMFYPGGAGDLAPNQDGPWLVWPQYPFHVQTNGQGLRNAEDLDEAAFRILAVGDSFTFGPYVSNQDTWPGWLESLLRADSSLPVPVQVLNAGVSGYTITDEAAYLRSKGLKVRPNLVILGIFLNDISDLRLEQRRHFARQSASEQSPTLWMVTRFLLRHSAFYDAMRTAVVRRRIEVEAANQDQAAADHWRITYGLPRDAESRRYWKAYGVHLRDVITLLNEAQVPLLLVLFPEFQQVLASGDPDTPQVDLKRIAHETHTPVVDLLPVFRRELPEGLYLIRRADHGGYNRDVTASGRGESWSGNGHLSRYGNYVAAQAIASHLHPLVREAIKSKGSAMR
jgi:lysophospholipase L1-like esterase